ncbi:hypothetical protein [Negadavirga shengliensis]|uniref:Uncharacterized protein n=1 Tax=Negadavirga shengliensis TaxID=1389218 RepID=A0ABV9T8X5_9BACT
MAEFLYFLGVMAKMLLVSLGSAEGVVNDDFPKAFEQLASEANTLRIRGNFDIDQTGGHLQGIQPYSKNGQNYVYMSGSSSKVAFMTLAQLGDDTKVVAVDTLMLDPYRHAGGFQIFDQYLAVGIEDNHLRNTSKVVIYDLEEVPKPWIKPLHVIDRDGEYESVTAGAVGITKVREHILIAVANWDCRNIDFYVCPWRTFQKGSGVFHLIQSMDTAQMPRENWSDPQWHSYQNLNLFTDTGGEVYMVGFGKNEKDQHVADLFLLQIATDFSEIHQPMSGMEKPVGLKKLAAKTFFPSGSADFKAGAGLGWLHDGSIGLFACPYHIDGKSAINIFLSKPYPHHPAGH